MARQRTSRFAQVRSSTCRLAFRIRPSACPTRSAWWSNAAASPASATAFCGSARTATTSSSRNTSSSTASSPTSRRSSRRSTDRSTPAPASSAAPYTPPPPNTPTNPQGVRVIPPLKGSESNRQPLARHAPQRDVRGVVGCDVGDRAPREVERFLVHRELLAAAGDDDVAHVVMPVLGFIATRRYHVQIHIENLG